MGEAGQFLRFDTGGINPAERFDYWRTWLSEVAEAPMRLEPVGAVPRTFDSSAESLQLGEVNVADLYCGPSACDWRREDLEPTDRLRIALFYRVPVAGIGNWHGHDVPVLRGGRVLCGRTAGWWRATEGFSAMQLNIPRTALPVPDVVIDRVTAAQPRGAVPVFDHLLRPMLLGVAGRLHTLSGVPADDLAATWLSVVTALLCSLNGQDAGAEGALARRLAARRFIAANLADPRLDPDAVARYLHVSRRSLYQLFVDDGGVARTIRRQRLERARQILLDPRQRHRPITDVAAAVGLPNAQHFSRLFRAMYGTSATEMRAHALAASA